MGIDEAGKQHMVNQVIGGLIFGIITGVCARLGLFGLSAIASILLFLLTLLDHLGSIQVPWGWHGAGSGPGRFNRNLSFGDILWEFLSFIINNIILYITFIIVYELVVGRWMYARHRA